VGFSNEVTIAVWMGYDNADGKRRTLGGGQTGGSLAVPIFEQVLQAVWSLQTPRTMLSPPSAAARQLLVASRADAETGEEDPNGKSVEYLRRDRYGRATDSRYALVSRDEVYSTRIEDGYNPQGLQPWGLPWDERSRQQPQSPRSMPSTGGFFGLFQRRDDEQQRFQQQQQMQQQQSRQRQQPQYQQPSQQPYRAPYPSYMDRY
jgi:penicillin-binding protein 1A